MSASIPLDRCGRAISRTRTGYRYCRKPAVWAVVDPLRDRAAAAAADREFGLCEYHYRDMGKRGQLPGPNWIRRLEVTA